MTVQDIHFSVWGAPYNKFFLICAPELRPLSLTNQGFVRPFAEMVVRNLEYVLYSYIKKRSFGKSELEDNR